MDRSFFNRAAFRSRLPPRGPIISGYSQIGCVSLERATRVTARGVSCVPTASQCQGREGVVEIGAWNYDAHTPNFPSLSRSLESPELPLSRLLSSPSPPGPSAPLAHPHHPPSPPYLSFTRLRCRVSASPPSLFSPLPTRTTISRSDYTSSGYSRMAASLAPSNQKPIICLRESLRSLSISLFLCYTSILMAVERICIGVVRENCALIVDDDHSRMRAINRFPRFTERKCYDEKKQIERSSRFNDTIICR